tara:strand:+ start:183 stop:443 length:261 start_codon:yes stop_codon:yes gene_type:complete
MEACGLLVEDFDISETAKELFRSDFIVACTIKDWELMEKVGFTEKEFIALKYLSELSCYAEKNKETLSKLEKLGIHSMFGELPPGV